MICPRLLPLLGNIALATLVLSATDVTATGQTVALPYQVSASEHSTKPALPATFLAAPAFRVSEVSSSVIATDLNGDGKADLVVASAVSGEISVYLGTGQGKFSNPAVYSVGGHPVSIAAVDLKGSGRQDIVAANGSDETVSVLSGLGDGKFGPARIYAIGIRADLLAVGSLTRNASSDVAVVSTSGRKLAVLLNDGQGSLADPLKQALAKVPTSVAIAYLGSSGHADLAFGNEDGTVSVLFGRGNGRFDLPKMFSVATGRLSLIVAGDFNQDGKMDLAVGETDTHLLTVLLGSGDGEFSNGTHYSVGNNPASASALDVNGDSILDLVSVNQGSNTFSVLLGKGDGTFKVAVDYVVGDGPLAIASGDFYGRGFNGLAVLNAASETVSVIDGNGDGTFRAAPSYSGDLSPRSVAAGDLNGDGRPDLVVTNYCGSDIACGKGGTISVYLAKQSGGYTLTSKFPIGAGPVSVLLADLDGDKNLDAVVLNRIDKTVAVALGAGDGTFREPWTLSLAGSPASFAIGDFNKDGNADLAIASDCGSAKCSQPGSLQILFGAGDGSFTAGRTYTLGYSPTSIAVGDLRQTGNLDILVANKCGTDASCGTAGTATVLTGDGKGNFTSRADLALGKGPASIALASLTGGKILDLVVASESENAVSVQKGNGDGTFATAIPYNVGGAPRSAVVGDFAGSGNMDVAVANAKDSTVSVLFGKGDGTLQPAVAYSVAAGPESLAALAGKPGVPASLITANGNSAASEPGSDITELTNIQPATGTPPDTATITVANSTGNATTAKYGDQVTFMVTITPTSSMDPFPTGTVAVYDTMPQGTAICNVSSFTQGSGNSVTALCPLTTPLTGVSTSNPYPISAKYTDSQTTPTYSPATSGSISQDIGPAATTVTVPAVTAAYGQPASIVATVNGVTATNAVAPTGTMKFTIQSSGAAVDCAGASPAGTLAVAAVTGTNDSRATCVVSDLPGPGVTVKAMYQPGSDPNYQTSSSTATITVNEAQTSVALMAPSAATYGQSISIVATVNGVSGSNASTLAAPTGTIKFTVQPSGAAIDCTPLTSVGILTVVTLPGTDNSQVTCTVSDLPVTATGVSALYQPGSDPNYQTSSHTSGLSITSAPTTLTLSPPSGTLTLNQSVTFTATVSASAPGTINPTSGTVGFSVMNGTTIPLAPAITGTGSPLTFTYTTSLLAHGTNTVTASYTPSSGGQFQASLTTSVQTVVQGNTTIVVTSPNTASVDASSTTFTATVTASPFPTDGVPATSVAPTFFAALSSTSPSIPLPCSSSSSNVSIAGGFKYTCIVNNLPLAASLTPYSITAAYPGSSNFNANNATATAALIVSKAIPTVAVDTKSTATQQVNGPATFIANISAAASSAFLPTAGPVTFSAALPGASPIALICNPSSGTTNSATGFTYTCNVSSLPLPYSSGSYTISALYPGDLNFVPTQAAPQGTISLTQGATSVTLAGSPASPTQAFQQVTLTATVKQDSFSGAIPFSGSMTFSTATGAISDCVNPIAVDPNTGTAICKTTALPVATNLITAAYNADANFVSNKSSTVTQVVGQDASNITVNYGPGATGTTLVDQAATFTATITPMFPSPNLTPTGTVAFSYGDFSIPECQTASITPVGGKSIAYVANCLTYSLPASTSGSPVTVQYPGDATFSAPKPAGAPLIQIVVPTNVTVAVVSSEPIIVANQATQPVFTATVTPIFPGSVVPTPGTGVPLKGTVTFSVSGGDANLPNPVCSAVPVASSGTVAALTATCPISFSHDQSTTPFSVSATYSDPNFALNTTAIPSPIGSATQTVQDFSLSAPGRIFVTQGYSVGVGGSDPFFTSAVQSVQATSKAYPATFPDSVSYSCAIPPASSSTQSTPPTCTPPAAGAIGSGGTLPFSFAAASTATPGDYSFVLTGTDTSVPALSRSTSSFVVTVIPQAAPTSIVVTAAETVSASFSVPNPSDMFSFACPSMAYDSTSSKMVTVVTSVTPTPPVGSLYCAPTTSQGPLTSKAASFLVGNPISVHTTQAQVRFTPSGFQIAAFGLPIFAVAGWMGRRRLPKDRILRLFSLAMMLAGLIQMIGCGSNGFTGAAPTAASSLATGTYLIRVTATDVTPGSKTVNETYYSVVNLQLGTQ